MTLEEFYKIKDIIRDHIKTEWVSMNYQKHSIDMNGVNQIEEEIRRLVDDDKTKIRRR